MFTVKIRHQRVEIEPHPARDHPEDGYTRKLDETTVFEQADSVHVCRFIPLHHETPPPTMAAWLPAQYTNMLNVIHEVDADGKTSEMTYEGGQLLDLVRNDEHTWYLASLAWLLGPDGRTIERIAP